MNILQHTKTKSSAFLNYNHNGGVLSSEGGLLLIHDFLKSIQFDAALEKIRFHDERKFHLYTNGDLLKQLMYQIIAGYDTDASANHLSQDKACELYLGKPFASQASLSRFWNRFTQNTIDDSNILLLELYHQVAKSQNLQQMVIDLDSTHTLTFGNQEKSNYNTHYQQNGYHPLLAIEALTGMVLATQLRPGSEYTSNGVVELLEPVLHRIEKDTTVLLRGDSGFAIPELYEACEKQDIYYTIRLKRNNILNQEYAQKYIEENSHGDLFESEEFYYFIQYKAKSWDKKRTVAVRSYRQAGQMFFDSSEFIVTNCNAYTPEEIFRLYRKRADMENSIKELKLGFFYDKSDSQAFIENAGRMMVSSLAYNIITALKNVYLTGSLKRAKINKLRLYLFKVAGKIINHARQTIIQLSTVHVYQKHFNKTIKKIRSQQRLKIPI